MSFGTWPFWDEYNARNSEPVEPKTKLKETHQVKRLTITCAAPGCKVMAPVTTARSSTSKWALVYPAGRDPIDYCPEHAFALSVFMDSLVEKNEGK